MRQSRMRVVSVAVALVVAATTGAVAASERPAAAVPTATTSTSSTTGVPVDVRPVSAGATGRLVEGFGPTQGEHVEALGADAWHDADITGDGVRVGVIDFFDVTRYWNTAEHGPVPVPGTTAACFDNGADCTDDFFDGFDLGGEEHGVSVVETILDVAPGATVFIGQAATLDDYQLLIDWFADRNVSIINRSLGSRYDGPGDGRGPLNEIVDQAVARGITWFNSAGNNGTRKYYRHPVRLLDDRVMFGPGGEQRFLEFNGCIALGGIRWANDWDVAPSERTDYDAFVWESPTGDPASGRIVDESVQPQQLGAPPLERFLTNRCPSPGSSLYLELVWKGGSPTGDVIEILDYGSGMASFTSANGSAAVSVVDSDNRGVVAVGAIDPIAGGQIAFYSSRGPSNDGRVLPDVSGPANFVNTVQGRFAGTSASSAAVAGAAALLLDASLAAGPVALADLVRHSVVDRGPDGADNSFGAGEFRLPEPPEAAAATPARFVALDEPVRALDTRVESAVGPSELIGLVGGGDVLRLPMGGALGLPTTGLTAVAVNLTTVGPARASFTQALPTGRGTLGGFSNLNTDAPGQIRANFSIVPVGADGSISIYSIADGHLVVDVLGWFDAAAVPARAGRFVELDTAERLADTRIDGAGQPLRSGGILSVPMPSAVDPVMAEALVVTVTAADPTGPGWLQAIPNGRTDLIAATSTVNTETGGAVANTAIVPVAGDGISITGSFGVGGASHVVVDAVGYITSAAAPVADAGLFVALTPGRAFDSRLDGGPLTDTATEVVDAAAANGSGAGVPPSASAVVWNSTIVAAQRPGFARTWAAESTRPQTSSLNWTLPGEIRAAAVISGVDDGRARFQVDDGPGGGGVLGDLVVDVFGYFQ